MFTADQLVLHAIGDYVLQSHWMAANKSSRLLVALAHAFCYSVPFLWLNSSWAAMAVIFGSHVLIDRYRLAVHLVRTKNIMLAPYDCPESRDLSPATGYPISTPPWLAVWLLIAADNVCHVVINALALRYL